MVKKSNICSSIEGSKLSFNTRQFFQNRPYICEILGIRIYPFKLGINGYVEIEVSLDDVRTAVYSSSMTNKGDAINGGSVEGWSTKPIKKPELNKGTHTHSANFGILSGHSYAHIQSSHRDHLQSIDIQSRHPSVTQVINPLLHNHTNFSLLSKQDHLFLSGLKTD